MIATTTLPGTGRRGSRGSPDGTRRVLIVEDEPEMRTLLAAALRAHGWEPQEAATGPEAVRAVEKDPPAAVTLDIALRGESGYDVCRAIREVSEVPIIFVTGRHDEFDQVLGLELGADDFIVKPVSPAVLAARVAAAVRRANAGHEEEGPPLRVGRLVVDRRSRRAQLDGRDLALTKIEFDLLAVFMTWPDRAFDRDALLDRVWGDWYSDGHVVDVTIGRLRRKLADAGADGLIDTVRGVGYRLAARRE